MPKAKKATKTKKAVKAAKKASAKKRPAKKVAKKAAAKAATKTAKSSPKAAKAAKGAASKAKKPAKKAGAKKSNVRRPPAAPVHEVEPISAGETFAQAPAEPIEAAMLVPEPEVIETDVGWDSNVEG
ncbi:MAG TPA: hypothetical protein VFS15_10270 [Kofleriaceae bacterium]|nr:hypothetical protein [Kofleriaceae bacterium]